MKRRRSTVSSSVAGSLDALEPVRDEVDLCWRARRVNSSYGQRLTASFAVGEDDPLSCTYCGGEMKVLAFITDPRAIRAILEHREKFTAGPRGPLPRQLSLDSRNDLHRRHPSVSMPLNTRSHDSRPPLLERHAPDALSVSSILISRIRPMRLNSRDTAFYPSWMTASRRSKHP